MVGALARGPEHALSRRGPWRDQFQQMAATAPPNQSEIRRNGEGLASGLPRRTDEGELGGNILGLQHPAKKAMRDQIFKLWRVRHAGDP